MGKSTCLWSWVSILVLLEIGLGVLRINILQNCQSSFNPCFVGNRSGSVFDVLNSIYFAYVSILVLLEIGLGVALIIWFCCDMLRFNPCFVGNRSGSRHLTNTWYQPICFNPCFVGNRSGRSTAAISKIQLPIVSILVLLEIGLGVPESPQEWPR